MIPTSWGKPDVSTHTDTRLYGPATARAWDRLHPRLTHRVAWAADTQQLPILEGTVIRLQVARLPSGAIPKPVWLWYSRIDQTAAEVDRLWQAFLRRFDIEHTFRLFKQTLGWTAPKLRTPEAADRWTWLVLAAYTQLRLARRLAVDLRRPWEKPRPPTEPTAEQRMWVYYVTQRSKGHTPTGAELDHIAGTNNDGRRVLRRWKTTGQIGDGDRANAGGSRRPVALVSGQAVR